MLKFIWKQLFIFIMMSLVAMSCNDNGSDSDDNTHDEQHEVDGMELLINDTVVYKEFEGGYYVNDAESDISAVISIDSGTYDVEIRFLDHDGDVIGHEELEEEEHSLEFVIYEENGSGQLVDVGSSTIISLAVENHEGDEDDNSDEDEHHAGFELTGLSAGTSNFTVLLIHGGSDPEYSSLPVMVTVFE